jgi:Tfp pilus assembly protein PilV
MAGRELMIGKRVAGSTILEVLISMTVIIVIFGIAMMIYSNITRSSLSVKKIKAEAILKARLLNIEQNPVNLDESVTVGDFLVEQQIKPYGDSSRLTQVQLIAWNGNHAKVAELQKIIITP